MSDTQSDNWFEEYYRWVKTKAEECAKEIADCPTFTRHGMKREVEEIITRVLLR